MTSQNLIVTSPELGEIPLTFNSYGQGPAILLLHGGGGPATVSDWAEQAANTLRAQVIVPIHPGFDSTPRPEAVTTIKDVARVELALLDRFDLHEVTVIGNSIGGWIAMEIALQNSARVKNLILVDSVGITVPGHPIPDFFSMTPAELTQHSYYDPETYGIDPAKLPEEIRNRMAGNREPLARYAGSSMADPTLIDRISQITDSTLVLWGEADRIGDLQYGRALAEAIPHARFEMINRAGHLPQIEQPAELIRLVGSFSKLPITQRPA